MTRFYLRYAGRKDGAGEVYEIVDREGGVVSAAPAPHDELAPKCKEMNAGVSKAREAVDAWSAPISAAPVAFPMKSALQALHEELMAEWDKVWPDAFRALTIYGVAPVRIAETDLLITIIQPEDFQAKSEPQ